MPDVMALASMTKGPGGAAAGIWAEAGSALPTRAETKRRRPNRRTIRLPASVASRRRRRLLAARLLDDPHAGARADARRSRGHHGFQPLEVAHASGSLDAHLLAHHAAHQRHIRDGGAAGAEAGGRLHVIGTRRLGQRAGRDLLLVAQQRRFDADLAQRARLAAWRGHRLDVALDEANVAGLQRADVDDHVDLAGAIEDRTPGFVVLGVGRGGAERETHDRADLDAARRE